MYQKDNFLAPAFYDENEFKVNPENKRIGYYLDDGWFDTAPTIKRAVLEAKGMETHKFVRFYANVFSDAFCFYMKDNFFIFHF